MSQNNITVVLAQCIAKDLGRLLGISSKLCHRLKCSYFILGISTFPSPLNQVNNIDVCPSYILYSGLTWMDALVVCRVRTFSHLLHV